MFLIFSENEYGEKFIITCFQVAHGAWWWGRLRLPQSYHAWHRVSGSSPTSAGNFSRSEASLVPHMYGRLGQKPLPCILHGFSDIRRKTKPRLTCGSRKWAPATFTVLLNIIDELLVFLLGPSPLVGEFLFTPNSFLCVFPGNITARRTPRCNHGDRRDDHREKRNPNIYRNQTYR